MSRCSEACGAGAVHCAWVHAEGPAATAPMSQEPRSNAVKPEQAAGAAAAALTSRAWWSPEAGGCAPSGRDPWPSCEMKLGRAGAAPRACLSTTRTREVTPGSPARPDSGPLRLEADAAVCCLSAAHSWSTSRLPPAIAARSVQTGYEEDGTMQRRSIPCGGAGAVLVGARRGRRTALPPAAARRPPLGAIRAAAACLQALITRLAWCVVVGLDVPSLTLLYSVRRPSVRRRGTGGRALVTALLHPPHQATAMKAGAGATRQLTPLV